MLRNFGLRCIRRADKVGQRSLRWARCNGDAAGQLVEHTVDGLINFRLDGWAVGGEVLIINGSEDWTLMDDTVGIGDCALLNTGFKCISIPAV